MIVIVMGVVGAGKTTVGRMLADELGWQFADADDFHSQSNVDKIRHGIALTDRDREPWLEHLRIALADWIEAGTSVVLACSALKEKYRKILDVGPEVRFVFLKGSASLIVQRLQSRHGHFANEQILASQIADLEEPHTAIVEDISRTPPEIVADIRQKLNLA